MSEESDKCQEESKSSRGESLLSRGNLSRVGEIFVDIRTKELQTKCLQDIYK